MLFLSPVSSASFCLLSGAVSSLEWQSPLCVVDSAQWELTQPPPSYVHYADLKGSAMQMPNCYKVPSLPLLPSKLPQILAFAPDFSDVRVEVSESSEAEWEWWWWHGEPPFVAYTWPEGIQCARKEGKAASSFL